ncbi:hypothetical protein Poli38472_014267 [Pythium oligandrum]|uniref:Uncharacterized protein n=1 Tax=Pythium oligandrum TaxID=41045 RepID=A0A8K1CJ28_PYTOL|nr:hypothetical protein Poli38472_014267 [Pythium oligandrum]|eukprot:TMW64150.1 hypothetical protein Poli38472_014267 [Pythium oligandrum]
MLELPDLFGIFKNKERNRIIVKHCYYRKLTTLSELRAEAERLEAQYEQLIRVEHENSLAPSSAAELAQKTRLHEIRDAFVELAMISAALRRENEQPQQTLIDFEKTEKQLTQLYIAQHKKAERMKALMDAKKQMPIIHVRKIRPIDCAEVMTRAHNRITVFHESTDSFSSGVSVFGWRDRYQQVKDGIEFSMEKTFPSHSLESVADKTWDVFSHCETFAHMYPASLNAKFHELQRLDDNNVLFFHTLQMSGQDLLTKCLMLCSRVSVMDGDGCVLIFRSLDPRLFKTMEGENVFDSTLLELFQGSDAPSTTENDVVYENEISLEHHSLLGWSQSPQELVRPQMPGSRDAKARNRQTVKRYYYRRLSTLKELQTEMERLEVHHRRLIHEEMISHAKPSAEGDEMRKTCAQEIRDAYVELTRLSEALRRENDELQQTQADYEKVEKQLAQLYILEHTRVDEIETKVQLKVQEPIIKVRRVTSEETHDIMTRAYKRISVFRECTESFTSGMNVFGWRDRYQYEKKDLNFSMKKTFRHHSLDSVADKMWRLVNDGEAFAQLYPSSLHATFHEIQRLDDNNIVYFHTLQVGERAEFRTKSVTLCSRLSVLDGDGCLLVFLSLNPRKYVLSEGERQQRVERRGRQKIEPQVEEVWANVFVWALFRRSGPDGEHCVTEFGGTLFETPMLAASWWLVERLQCTIKFEQHVFGPMNLLDTTSSLDSCSSAVEGDRTNIPWQATV